MKQLAVCFKTVLVNSAFLMKASFTAYAGGVAGENLTAVTETIKHL